MSPRRISNAGKSTAVQSHLIQNRGIRSVQGYGNTDKPANSGIDHGIIVGARIVVTFRQRRFHALHSNAASHADLACHHARLGTDDRVKKMRNTASSSPWRASLAVICQYDQFETRIRRLCPRCQKIPLATALPRPSSRAIFDSLR